MLLTINGQEKEICSSSNLAELLRELEIASPHCAVALNQQVVPRTKLDQTGIREGDQVEIVHAVGGGL
ncbi:MAG TPA: sulfur carrier protein ThiS [Nitrospinaceae bacterium]|nr:sulfur carrier protein ThiS [Nitrospinaceae bacterium]HJL73587.1 sulfur carrier protein ThiS [Nitrospinaceae bacterium]